jgi:hypothetical protein
LPPGFSTRFASSQVDEGFFRQDVGEDREEDAEIGGQGVEGQPHRVHLLEPEVRPPGLAARVVEQLRHHVEAEVAQRGVAGELGGEPAGAAADVDDRGAVAQALAPQERVLQHAVVLVIATTACAAASSSGRVWSRFFTSCS